ncbi:Caspase-8 [Gryllus bimaculatus]|nr:Caspase-8 [Gryllus bimaculatus]
MNHHPRVNYKLSVLLQHILDEDKLLDIHEKTSLVFLMCDDPFKAHCILANNIFQSEKYSRILPDLVGHLKQTGQEIIDKFLESFILIKNYQVVKHLGLDINHLKEMFQENENKQYVNSVRKALLRMCESLSDDELTQLTRLIEKDLNDERSSLGLHKTNLMEFILLYLICKDYISDGTKDKESNVNNLIRHLNKMNKHDLARELQKVNKARFVDEENELSVMCPDNDFLEKNYSHNFAPKPYVSSDTECYKMDKNNMGLCVVFNQRDFCEEQCLANGVEQLSTRTGTDCDKEMLNITFTGLGFETIIYENLPSDALLKSLKEIVQQKVLNKHSSFVLCILSHGKRDEIYCVDGIPVNVEEIEKLILGDQCPQLLGKPKLIFIQACQGSEFQKGTLPCNLNTHQDNSEDDCKMPECDGPKNLVCEKKIPPTADMLTFWATVPGYATYRHRQTGTIFVQTLCACLLKHGQFTKHFEDIVTLVNNQLSKMQFGNEGYVSMSQD